MALAKSHFAHGQASRPAHDPQRYRLPPHYRCQVEKLLFYGRVFSRFGKLPIFGRFVPQIIGPIHRSISSQQGWGAARRTRGRVAGASYACSARPDLHSVCRSFPKISSVLSAKICGGSRSAKKGHVSLPRRAFSPPPTISRIPPSWPAATIVRLFGHV
jgi:hypothetical protein